MTMISASPAPRVGCRRCAARRWFGIALLLTLFLWALTPAAQERSWVVAFANLTEEPGVTLEGTGFTGRDVHEGFALAARQWPIDLVFYDNRRDPQTLRPSTRVLTHGFDPSLSVGSARPAVFRSSTYVFSSPEAAERAFNVAAGRAQLLDGEQVDLIYSRLNHPNAEILEDLNG